MEWLLARSLLEHFRESSPPDSPLAHDSRLVTNMDPASFVAPLSCAFGACQIGDLVLFETSPTSKEVLQTTIETYIARISPRVLFAETVHILLNFTAHLEGFVLGTLPKGILPTPLAPGQSLLLIWPHLTTLFAMVAVCFNEHGS